MEQGEGLFDPFTFERDAWALVERLNISIQWEHMQRHLCCRCRMPNEQWGPHWERKWNLRLAVINCVAHWQAGKEQKATKVSE